MRKIVIAGIAAALSLAAGVASAQSLYSASGACLSISGTLSLGSSGPQVLALQKFIVAQGFPGSGAWMETGYFGRATQAGVADFQQSEGLPQTGIVDSATAAALDSCGTASFAPTQENSQNSWVTYPGYPGYSGSTYSDSNWNYTSGYPYTNYPYNYGYTSNGYNWNYGTPAITSLSQNTGAPGNTITIYGQGFDPSYNTIYFGGQAYSGISSSGTSISFTIPYLSYGSNQTVQLYVTDSHGTSNSVSFTLYPSGTSCGTYPYSSSCSGCGSYSYANCNCGSYLFNYGSGCGSPCSSTYGYNCPATITYLSPQSGSVGTSVTVYGSGFTTSGNTVRFGNGIITGLQSPDGRSVSFTIPAQLNGYGSQPLVVGTYQVSVTNANNSTSNAVPFTVTSTGSGGAPVISNETAPTSLAVGTAGTWTMTINTEGNSYVSVFANWGDTGNGYVNAAAPQIVSGVQTITFTHAYETAGTYTATFTASNQAGQSTTYTATVSVYGSNTGGTPWISSITPSSAYTGQQVTIYGSNFSQNNNTINFGSGAIQNAYSNGSSITFTVPSSVSPYCQSGYACPQYVQAIVPGTYNVSVMDQWGTSNTVSFTVL